MNRNPQNTAQLLTWMLVMRAMSTIAANSPAMFVASKPSTFLLKIFLLDYYLSPEGTPPKDDATPSFIVESGK